MESNNNLWEYKESINRPQATPLEIEKVKQQIEYSNRLVKAHNVMKVLDLPDNQDNPIRKILLKQEDSILEALAKKSKKDIQTFLKEEKNKEIELDCKNLNLENQKNEQKLSQIDELKNKQDDVTNKNELLNNEKETKLNQDIKKIKSVFTPQILEQNYTLSNLFQNLDNESVNEKDKALKGILGVLKNDNGKLLKSIIDQLWWADKNNPQYLEFKNTLVWLDSWFEQYIQDLEKISSWKSLNANDVISWIEKDSWWMIELDLNSNTPTSKLSLIWSRYSFDEEIDKKAYNEIMWEWEKELADVQNSFTILKGLYKPFEWLWKNIKANLGKDNLKDKINETLSSFSKSTFNELDGVYEKTGISSDIQIKESDISSLREIKTEQDLNSKFENLRTKLEKIKEKVLEFQTGIMNKYNSEIKNVLSLKAEQKEKQVEVLNFMRDSGFDLIPKEISDKLIRDLQAQTLKIPWLDLDIKNINLKNGNFWESVLYKDDGLNIHSKTNMLKFMNKLISWDINQPLNIESISNGTEKVNPSFLQNKFLEAWLVDSLWWREGKISENLGKVSLKNNQESENKAK